MADLWFPHAPEHAHDGYTVIVCSCDAGPYIGARKAGTPCCCEVCGFITQEQLDALLAAVPAPSLGAGSAGDVEGLAQAMCEGQGGWWNFIQGTRKDEYRRHARAVIESQWLAAHVARASTADRERVLGEVLEALRIESVDAHDPMRQRGRDLWGLNVARRVVTSLAAPHVEPSP